jgi:hypothetical protein
MSGDNVVNMVSRITDEQRRVGEAIEWAGGWLDIIAERRRKFRSMPEETISDAAEQLTAFAELERRIPADDQTSLRLIRKTQREIIEALSSEILGRAAP